MQRILASLRRGTLGVLIGMLFGLTFASSGVGAGNTTEFVKPDALASPSVGDRLLAEVKVRGPRGEETATLAFEAIATNLAPGSPVPESIRRSAGSRRVPATAPETMKGGWFAERPPSGWILVRVDVVGRDQGSDKSSYSFLPEDLIDAGFYELAELMNGPAEDRPTSRDDVRLQIRLQRALEGFIALGNVVAANKHLKPIFASAGKSSILKPSFKTRMSITVGARYEVFYGIHTGRIKEVESLLPVRAGETSFELPLDVKVNQESIGQIRFQVVRPRAPYSLTAGIASISAIHPETPEHGFDIRIIGASSSGR